MGRFGQQACALTLPLWLVGCPASDGKERSEAAALSRAIDTVRNTDNAQKAGALQTLRAQPCTFPDICAVRSACIAAYELHVRGVEAAAKAAGLLNTDEAPKAAELLGAAESDLKRASELANGCTSAQGELQRRYRVTE
jgi:hypothetical protein